METPDLAYVSGAREGAASDGAGLRFLPVVDEEEAREAMGRGAYPLSGGYFGRMHFCLVDSVVERAPGRIVTVKQVSAAEEYLQDHFPTFPVLPGVMMVESMVQAARELAAGEGLGRRLVLGSVRGVKYGAMVRPGERLRVEVTRNGDAGADGSIEFKGTATVASPTSGPEGATPTERTAVSGRFTLRPVRLGPG